MSRITCLLAFAAILFGAAPVSAQPLFHTERNWTVEIDGRLYGLRDTVQKPGGYRWTEIWIASRLFAPTHQEEDRWMLAIPPVTAILTVRHLIAEWGMGGR